MESGFAEAFDEHRDPSLTETDALRRWKLAVVVASSLSRWRMKKNSFAEASDEHRDLYLQETDVLRRWKLAVVVVGSRSKWRRKKIRNELDISVSIAAQLLHNEQIKKHVKRDNEPDTTSWRKGSTLGSGSYGTVYEATDANGFSFAIKEVSLLDQGSRGNQSIDQLEQEIALLGRLEHENIVQYYGTKKDELKLYIFLELVTPGSLLKVYQKSRLRDSQVSEYTKQILHGLKYLHDRNVVHRDIKCANILVDENGCVKIVDFGLAKAIKFNDLLSCKGTAHWMAPELVDLKKQQYGLAIYRGRLGSTVLEKLICPISNEDLVDNFIKQQYGLAADIWSLGCTVLEMSSGQIPYAGLEWQQALFEIGKGRPPPIPDFLSNDAKDFIQQCLRVEACDRPTAAELLEHPFVKKGKRQKF